MILGWYIIVMKKYFSIMFIIVFLLLLPGIAFANDASMGRMGETVYPLQETDVRMVSEDIFIKFNSADVSGDVTCEFVFENPGEAKSVLMGFPASMKVEFEGMTTEERVSLNNFTSFINGSQIPVSEINGSDMEDKFSKYPTWYVFEVPFEAGEVLTMTHTYDVFFTSYSEGSINIGYILETGSTWSDSIGHSIVTFDLTEVEPWGIELAEYSSVDDFRFESGLLIFDKKDFKPDFNLSVMTNARYYNNYSGPWEPTERTKEWMQFILDSEGMSEEELVEAFANLSYEPRGFELIWMKSQLDKADENIENPNTGSSDGLVGAGLVFLFLAGFMASLKKLNAFGLK